MSKKTLLILTGSVLSIILIAIAFISPFTKYAIEKYDKQYTGRQITLDWAYVNPFSGYIHLSGLKILELDSDSVFISADGLSVNIALWKLISKTYELSEVTLTRPRGMIIQRNEKMNFSDLVQLFSKTDSTRGRVHFNIAYIKIVDGEFHYSENLIPIKYFIKKANFESDGKYWDADTISTKFSFIPGVGSGDMKGDFTINVKNNDYRLSLEAKKFDLKFIQQYIKDMANYANFSASLDAKIQASGNLNDQEDITTTGRLVVNDFHFGKDSTEDYASFKSLKLVILNLSPKNHRYTFDSVSLHSPNLKYERYDYLDNFQNMFGGDGAKITTALADSYKFNLVIEVARYVKVLSRNFFISDYRINSLSIQEGNFLVNDFSLTEQFSVNLNPISIKADSIDKSRKRVNVYAQSAIKPYGDITIALSLNPKDSGEYEMRYKLQKLPVSMFNPYIIFYTSFSVNRGTIECKGEWKVRNGLIQSNNHLLIIDPRVTRRLRNDDMKWIPLPFVMALIRERGNMVDYSIPITGNLKDPNFHFGDAVLDLLKNVFVKPPTTPYGIQVKNAEAELEKSLIFSWPTRSSDLEQNQERFIERMADFLMNSPDASIDVYPLHYENKEKEHVLLFEAKKKYFSIVHHKTDQTFDDSDEELVDFMSVKDKAFMKYVDREVNDSMVFTTQEKSTRLVSPALLAEEIELLKQDRQDYFMDYFRKRKVEQQLILHPSQNVIPYNGFSYYRIEYKNELPAWLIKAYKEMNKINNDPPRRKLRLARQESKLKL
jgi:hypothetical protein